MARRVIPVVLDPKSKEAKEQLAMINEAINRDRVLYEQKKSDIDVLLVEEEKIKESIKKLEKELDSKDELLTKKENKIKDKIE